MEELVTWAAAYGRPEDVLSACVSSIVREIYPDELQVVTSEVSDEWQAPLTVLNMHAKEFRLKSYLTWDYLKSVHKLEDVEHCSAQAEEELARLLEVLCIAAFNGPQKAIFVQDIMDMDARVQERVYAVLTRASSEAESIAAGDVHSPKKTIDVNSEILTPSPHTFAEDIPSSSRGNEMNRLIRANSILKDENQSLVQEIQALKTTISSLETNESKRIEELSMLQLQMEVDKAKYERSIKEQHKSLVQKLQNDLDAVEQKYHALNHVEKELAELKDEMDIVRSTADKAEKLQAQLDKYKLKIDEMPRLREANKRLETKNHELSEKVIHQTEQLQKLSNVHRKLEDSKDSLTTMAIQMRELEIAASKREEERLQLVAELEAAKQEITLQTNLKLDLQKLLEQVQTTQPLEFGAERLELDADMQEKLEALQLENGRLKRQLNSEAADHVEKLLDEIDSLTRLQKSFEAKFITTRDALDAMTNQWNEEKQNVAFLTQTKSELQEQCSTLINEKEMLIIALQESNEATKKCEADWTMKLDSCNELNAKQVAQLSSIIEEKSFGIQNLQTVIQTLEKDVSTKSSIVEELSSVNSALQLSVEKLNEQLVTSRKALDDVNLKLACTQMKAEDLHGKFIAEHHENERLRLQHEGDSRRWMGKLQAINEELVANQSHLKEAQRNLAAASQSVIELRSDNEDKDSKISILEHIQHDMKTMLTSLDGQVLDLNQMLRFTRENFAMVSEDLTCREAQVLYYSRLSNQLENATDNLNGLQREYDSMIAEWSKDQEALLQANTLLSATKGDVAQLKNELTTLKEYQEKWSTDKSAMEEALADYETRLRASDSTCSELQALVDELKENVADMDQIKGELNNTIAQISTLRAKEKAGERQFKDLVAQHAMEMSAKNTVIESLELRISRAELKSRVLEKDRASTEPLKPEMSKHQIFLNGRFDYFRGEYESLQKSYERLQERMNQCSCQHTTDIAAKGYVESLKSAQILAQEEERKRRQLLRDHTQLLHDYNKLLTQHGNLTQEVKILKEKNSSLQLREARRDRDFQSRQVTPIPSPIDNVLRPCRDNAIEKLTLAAFGVSRSPSIAPGSQPSNAEKNDEEKPSSSLNSSPVPKFSSISVERVNHSASSLAHSILSVQDTARAPGSSPTTQSTALEHLNTQVHQPSLLKALNPMKRNIASVYSDSKDRPSQPPEAPDNCKQQ